MSVAGPPPAPERGDPYRTPASASREREAADLVYAPRDETGGREGLVVLYRSFGLPGVLASGLGWLAGPTGAIVGVAAGVAYGFWGWRSTRKVGRAVLNVVGGRLTVTFGARARELELPLSELLDVGLDVKTIERVMDGAAAIPAMRFIDSKVGPKIDTARIVLYDASGRETPLTDEYLPHFDATDWLGKIRVFLRRRGWVPEDEREPSLTGRAPDEDDRDGEA